MSIRPGTWDQLAAEDLTGNRLNLISQNVGTEEEKTISEFELLRYTGARIAALTIGYVPEPTGNTANLNGFVRVPDGSIYFIDIHGKAIKMSGVESYQHEQSAPANIWTINHNMGKRPSIFCRDDTGEEIEGEVTYPSLNQAVITYTVSVAGTADCN
ncbi:MAG: hypothetical protein ABI002_05910 [Saprospiraceae bacterium]